MPFRRPTNTNLEAWYTAAQRIDQAQLTNETFQSMLQSTTTAPTCSALPWSTPLSTFRLPHFTPSPIPLRLTLPVLSRGIPIDVDAVWKAHSLPPRECYQCREANHLVKDYPHHLDIRKLTMEQWKELIKDLIALKNAVEEEEVGSIPEKDFV